MSSSPYSHRSGGSHLALYLPRALVKDEAIRQPDGTQISGGSL
jgi:hypothetical protein